MEFLQLFPVDAQYTPLLFTNYRQMGILCWSGTEPNILTLVSALTDDNVELNNKQQNSGISAIKMCNVLFKRITRVQLLPELPHNIEFSQLLVNSDGSFVALIGKQIVFVVEMDPDFWHRSRFVGNIDADFEFSVEHLRAEYLARCDLLHITLFMRKYPPSVLKTVWFDAQKDAKSHFDLTDTLVPNGLLALLYTDNVVRFYDVKSMIDRPVAQFDFNILLPDRTTPSESGDEFICIGVSGTGSGSNASRPQSTLGFFTQLVSFDFGLLYLIETAGDSNSLLYGSILALDSNGELYMAFFPIKLDIGLDIPPPIGPIPCQMPSMKPSISSRLICSSLDLHRIRHAFGQLLSIWVLVSEDGLIVHLVLTRRMVQFAEHTQKMFDVFRLEQLLGIDTSIDSVSFKPPFELFTIECLEIVKTFTESEKQHRKTTEKQASEPKLSQFGGEIQRINKEKRMPKPYKEKSPFVVKVVRLQSDTNTASAAYFIISCQDVYHVSLVPLIGHLLEQCTRTGIVHHTVAQKPQSLIYQLLMFAGEIKDNLEISSLATLGYKSSISQLKNSEQEQQQRKQLLLTLRSNIASCEDERMNPSSINQKPKRERAHTFLATLLSSRPTTLSLTSSKPIHNRLPTMIPSIVDDIHQLTQQQFRLPNIRFDNDNVNGEQETITLNEIQQLTRRAKHLSLMQSVINDLLLSKALPQRDQAISYGIRRATDMLVDFQAMEKFYTSIQQRLITIFRQIICMKTRILKQRREFFALENRVRRIFHAMQPLIFSAAGQEQNAIDRLREMEHHLVQCQQEMAKLNERLNEYRQMLFRFRGSCSESDPLLSSFSRTQITHPSNTVVNAAFGSVSGGIPAQMFILYKNGRACNKLHERLQLLEKQIKQRQSE